MRWAENHHHTDSFQNGSLCPCLKLYEITQFFYWNNLQPRDNFISYKAVVTGVQRVNQHRLKQDEIMRTLENATWPQITILRQVNINQVQNRPWVAKRAQEMSKMCVLKKHRTKEVYLIDRLTHGAIFTAIKAKTNRGQVTVPRIQDFLLQILFFPPSL